jgi:hypothetical protein
VTVNKLSLDSRNRSYSDRVVFNQNYPIFEATAQYLGELRRQDFHSISQMGVTKPLLKDRIKTLQNLGAQDVYAKGICTANDSQWSLAWRTLKDNRREWHQDVKYAKKHPKNKKAQRQAERASKLLVDRTFPTVCLGGRLLWKQAQSSTNALEEFKLHRWWLGAVGRSDYYYQKTDRLNKFGSNQMIRLAADGSLSIVVPKALWPRFGLSQSSSLVTIGSVKYHHGLNHINNALVAGKSITLHLQRVSGHWKLRAQLQLELPTKAKAQKYRLLSIDTNSGHVEATILDQFGNPTSHLTLSLKKRGAQVTVNKLLARARVLGVTHVAMEELSGLQRACTRSGGGRKNQAVSQIKSGELKKRLGTACEDSGWPFDLVNPAGTSKYASAWIDVVCSNDTHLIASYLIGRRALGLTINRELVRARRGQLDSGLVGPGSPTFGSSSSAGLDVDLWEDELPPTSSP